MPLVSVIMPAYNVELYIAEAIDSILAQTFADFELIIVVDGSQDASATIARSYQQRDSRILVFQHERNMGRGGALNRGMAIATGKYIAWMDSDDVSSPMRLESQVDFLEAYPEIGAVGTQGKIVNENLSTIFTYDVPQQHSLIVYNLYLGMSFLGASVMIRRPFLEAVGGFDSSLMRAQDTDLFARLVHDTDIRFANLPECHYLYRKYAQNIRTAASANTEVIAQKVIRRMVEQLWDEAPAGTIERFQRLRFELKLNWAERRAAKKDLRRFIELLISHNYVDAEDRPLLHAAMNRRLESTTPRRWQQFCHWRRHRLGF